MEDETERAGSAELPALAHTLAELLDKIGVRPEAGYEVQRKLGDLMSEWKAKGGNSEGEGLIARAQGTAGMINASGGGDPMRNLAYDQLREYKNELRELARRS
jgi:hypothetical protein